MFLLLVMEIIDFPCFRCTCIRSDPPVEGNSTRWAVLVSLALLAEPVVDDAVAAARELARGAAGVGRGIAVARAVVALFVEWRQAVTDAVAAAW